MEDENTENTPEQLERLSAAVDRYLVTGDHSVDATIEILEALSPLYHKDEDDRELVIASTLEVMFPLLEGALSPEGAPDSLMAQAFLAMCYGDVADMLWEAEDQKMDGVPIGRLVAPRTMRLMREDWRHSSGTRLVSFCALSPAKVYAGWKEQLQDHRTLLVVRGYCPWESELSLATDYQLGPDGLLRVWIEKRKLLPREQVALGVTLTLDEALSLGYALHFMVDDFVGKMTALRKAVSDREEKK